MNCREQLEPIWSGRVGRCAPRRGVTDRPVPRHWLDDPRSLVPVAADHNRQRRRWHRFAGTLRAVARERRAKTDLHRTLQMPPLIGTELEGLIERLVVNQ